MPHVIKKLRANFAARLSEALSFAGLDNSPTSLARHFNRHASGYSITMHGARRWLLGESMPTQRHMTALARSLGVSADWLLIGQGEMQEGISTAPRLSASEAELIRTFHALSEPERELVWGLMRMLISPVRRNRIL